MSVSIFPENPLAKFRVKYGAKAKHQLSAAFPESLTMAELLEFATAEEQERWRSLNLGYAANVGDASLREQIAEQYPGLSADHICTFAGAQEAIFVVYHALLKAGDRVQTISPHFGPLQLVAQGLGANIDVQNMSFDESGAWSLDVDQWCQALTPETLLAVINFPHNPTGATLSQQQLDSMVAASAQHDCWLFSDEVFRGLEYQQLFRLSPVASRYEKGISLGVMSKAYGLGGVRVGWIACKNTELHKRMREIKEYLSICNGRVDELLASVALRHGEQLLQRSRQFAQDNLRTLEQHRSAMPSIKWAAPKAGFLMYPQVVGENSAEPFVLSMLERSESLAIPGSCFGLGARHFRLGFGCENFHWQALVSASKSSP